MPKNKKVEKMLKKDTRLVNKEELEEVRKIKIMLQLAKLQETEKEVQLKKLR